MPNACTKYKHHNGPSVGQNVENESGKKIERNVGREREKKKVWHQKQKRQLSPLGDNGNVEAMR